MIGFIEKQDKTNRLIKELASKNYDAGLQWINHCKADAVRRNFNYQTEKGAPKIRNFTQEDNPVNDLPIYRPSFAMRSQSVDPTPLNRIESNVEKTPSMGGGDLINRKMSLVQRI